MKKGDNDVELETKTYYENRLRRDPNARQKYLVAASFIPDSAPSSTSGSSYFDEYSEKEHVYYGDVEKLVRVLARFRCKHTSKETIKVFEQVYISWHYGLRRSKHSRSVYQKLSDSKSVHSQCTLEKVSCIQRVIGFFKFQGNKFFLDTEWRNL